MNESSGSLSINGEMFDITYKWLMVNDGGDLKVFCWEPLPAGAPDDAVPDLIMESSVRNEHEAKQKVDWEVRRALTDLARSMVHVSCLECGE
jgi:hypothetical protein